MSKMCRDRTKELLDLPVLLEARHLLCGCGSAFRLIGVGVTDSALGWFPLGFVADKHFEH